MKTGARSQETGVRARKSGATTNRMRRGSIVGRAVRTGLGACLQSTERPSAVQCTCGKRRFRTALAVPTEWPTSASSLPLSDLLMQPSYLRSAILDAFRAMHGGLRTCRQLCVDRGTGLLESSQSLMDLERAVPALRAALRVAAQDDARMQSKAGRFSRGKTTTAVMGKATR
jgi:hypothetical protein